jgi:N,N'-diacetyllegionaminate synthase
MNPWRGKHGPLLIAEIGGNHEGDFNYALRLLDLALESDSDVVKFQVYTGDTLVSRVEGAVRNQHFKKFELSIPQYLELARRVEAGKKIFMASIWDLDMIDELDNHMPIYKIGSGDLTAYPLLRDFANRGKPMVVSTGLATADEVAASVEFIRDVNPVYRDPALLAVLQCTSMYPIPASDANLAVMGELKARLGTTVGYSDHTEGMRALEIAYAMGADVMEFHFTDTREGKSFRDHKVSLTAPEVHQLQARLREITELRGDSTKQPLPVEDEHVVSFRRAVYPRFPLAKDTILTTENLMVLRPNHGIDAREFGRVVGRRLLCAVDAHQKLEWDMLSD